MKTALVRFAAIVAILGGLVACGVITEPTPYAQGILQPRFNHAWNNAIDAMKDEGVAIAAADLAGGRIEGRRGGITVTGTVVTRSSGSIRAEFVASGALSEDPGLAERVQRRYDERMAK